ncbi:sensor histidine kinase [Orrella marina]|uniref:sensor histidine kinase n=1 Tax=Orrella marina TaxID=2163011 RepID=UPI001D1325AB|nr:sensor histidine kinase [Orrella marina]
MPERKVPALLDRLRPGSLRSTLLWLLIPPVVMAMVLSFWASSHELRDQVNAAFDRSLAGALRSIQVNLRTESGGLGMEQPFYLLEFLSLTTGSNVYFRVGTEDGLTEIGYADLPLPSESLQSDRPVYYNGQYHGEALRLAAIAIELKQGLHYSPDSRVIIVVGEETLERDDFIERVMLQSFRKDVIVVLIMILLILAGVIMVVRPLKQTSEAVRRRSFDDLQPIDEEDLPREIRPLIQAINLHMHRYAERARTQQQFLDDASHQLRTPLSVLTTQVEYARQLAQTDAMKEVLDAVQMRLRNTVRLTNQMLSLAKVHDAADKLASRVPDTRTDLCRIAEEVVGEFLPAARKQRMDFGLDVPAGPVHVRAIGWLVSQALSNMVSNALIYCPPGSRITVSVRQVGEEVWLEVEDDGPGMSEQDIALARHRFRRGESGQKMQGSGLGLAIVQTIAQINHARLDMFAGAPGKGLLVRLSFPVS